MSKFESKSAAVIPCLIITQLTKNMTRKRCLPELEFTDTSNQWLRISWSPLRNDKLIVNYVNILGKNG